MESPQAIHKTLHYRRALRDEIKGHCFQLTHKMEQLLDYKTFYVISNHITPEQYRNLKILCVFGGISVIYVTNDDKVYGFGNNSNGCLGLGADYRRIHRPALNPYLSGKYLADVAIGRQFCIGLTADGRCYSWGANDFGQLGVGYVHKEGAPKLMKGLADKRVIRICASQYFALALTECGRVYGWGRNSFGLLCERTHRITYYPKELIFDHKIADISCDSTHAMALTDTGRVYTWGNNRNGQLGRGLKILGDRRPMLSTVCGSDHSMLLTTDGEVYAFGMNSYGQVGNGIRGAQFLLIQVSDRIIFKDIVTNNMSNMSIGVAVDGEYYIWGECEDKLYSKFKTTYKTIVCPAIHLTSDSTECSDIVSTDLDTQSPQEITCFDKMLDKNSGNRESKENVPTIDSTVDDKTIKQSSLQNMGSNISITSSLNATIFQQNLSQSFNNPEDSDIVFRFRDQLIYGHKLILKMRNKKFWHKCEHYMDADGKEIRVKQADIVDQLLTLANIYGEESLASLCSQFMIQSIDVFNVCQLYAKALDLKCEELETKCHHFMAQNMKEVCLTQEFSEFDGELAKQLIIQAFIAN
ncbi:unnamed protein product [Medioppia subpectinata]|uniref:RCC1 and BTB domain-containing protein 1 n=1 Tax=Medioppia subpectinata TaxID=1979941 RepID=A0A7R9KCH3_9ACAR|nr:unnamed protein product [Medioppia subpectinata]CAG2100952.1 unnamed protein product [Medioppia subpectinata]